MSFFTNNYLLISIIIILLLVFLIFKKKAWIKSSIIGVATLAVLNVFAFITNFTIGINILTVCTAIILGLPGTLLMIALKFI